MALVIVFWLVAAALAIIPGKIAQRKGRRFWAWWLFAFLLFLPALIASLLVSSKQAGVASANQQQAAEKAMYELHASRRR